jgi:hypothetical protein
LAAPHTTSSMRAGSSSGTVPSTAVIAVAARSSGRTPERAPRNRPKGVLVAEYTNAVLTRSR